MLMCEELFFLWVKYWDILSRGKILKPWVGEELRKVGWGEVELEQRVVLWFGTDQSNQTNTLPGVFFILQNFYELRRSSLVFLCLLRSHFQFVVCAWGVDWIYSVSCVDWFWLYSAFCIIDGTWLTPAPLHLEEVLNTALMLVIGPGRPLRHKLVITA